MIRAVQVGWFLGTLRQEGMQLAQPRRLKPSNHGNLFQELIRRQGHRSGNRRRGLCRYRPNVCHRPRRVNVGR